MTEQEQKTQELQVFVKSMELLKTAGNVLEQNQAFATKCEVAGNYLLTRINEAGAMNDELDEKCKAYLQKTSVRVKEMNELRSPITQIITALSKKFPEQENRIAKESSNSPANKIQKHRDAFATWKAKEAQRVKDEALKREKVDREKGEYKGNLFEHLSNYISLAIQSRKLKLKAYFDEATLEDIDGRRDNLKAAVITIHDKAQWNPSIPYIYLSASEAEAIKQEVLTESWPAMEKRYVDDLDLYRNSLGDQIETKRETLLQLLKAKDDAEKLNKLRAEEEERRRQATLKEQQDQQIQRQKDQQTKQNIVSGATTASLFNTVVATQAVKDAPTKPSSYDIILVKNPAAGYLMIINAWFQEVGMKQTVEDLDKFKFGQIKTWAANKKLKEDFTIESEFITYHAIYKASNR